MSNYLTRKQTYRILKDQLQEIIEFHDEEKSIILKLYWPAISKLNGILLLNKEITDDVYEELKAIIHVCSSTTSHFETHGISSPIGETHDDFFFGYLYSVLDTLVEYEEWGYREED